MYDILKSTVADSVQLKVEAHIQNGVFFFSEYLFISFSSERETKDTQRTKNIKQKSA